MKGEMRADEREFTPEEPAGLNGDDGGPVYVASGGGVFDISESRLWVNGTYMNRYWAGRDRVLAGQPILPEPDVEHRRGAKDRRNKNL